MKKIFTHIYRPIIALLCTMYMTSCTSTQASFAPPPMEEDLSELLTLRARPTNSSELRDECRCMDDKIEVINNFTDKMTNSKFGFLYQSLGRQKVTTINSYKSSLNCQRLEH